MAELNLDVVSPFGRYADLERLAQEQAGIVSRKQARRLGVTDEAIACTIAARRWQRVLVGVYALFTGPLPPASRLWAGLAWAGDGAALGAASALRQFGMRNVPDDGLIHVVVDHRRRVQSTKWVAVTRRSELARFLQPSKSPPTVRLEDAVLHEAAAKLRVVDGLALIADACQQRLTTESRLRTTLDGLTRLRNRRTWLAVLDDVATGARSVLEVGYLRRVERAHGLPTPDRQRAGSSLGRRVWRDGDYPPYGVTLELDGRLGHEWASDRRRDRRRDLVVAGRGGVTLRHGYGDVLDEMCESAAHVAKVLWTRGWAGRPTECGTNCRLAATLRLLETA